MDAVLKSNIWRMLIFILISAVLGLLSILSYRFANGPRDFPLILLFVYVAACLLTWIYGTFVIRKLPFKRVWRIILGFAWLIIYPRLAYFWLVCCIWGLIVLEYLHH